MSTPKTVRTVEAWRLEKVSPDTNTYKCYTVFTDGQDLALFGYGRIGSTWQWVDRGGDVVGRAQSQIMAKLRGGYYEVWRGDLNIPTMWWEDHKIYARQLQDLAETAYRETGLTDPRDPQPVRSGPSSILEAARDLVAKVAVNPDKHLAEYAALVGRYEEAKNTMETTEGYIDTLQILLAQAGQEV